MDIDIIRELDKLNSLENEWNQLHKDCASAVPFLRHEYLAAWWQTLGGGEWAQGDLYVVTARREDGTFAGIAPLFLTHNRDGLPALMLLGSIEISDYLDLIARPADLPDFVEALLEHLGSPEAPALAGTGLVQPARFVADPAPANRSGRAARLDGGAGTASALPLHLPARRLGSLPGRTGRQEAAPRDPPQNAPHRGAERPL